MTPRLPSARPFWEAKRLAEMTTAEWESLCDGCGRCCLIRLEDEDTGEIIPTRIACRLFDGAACACSNYPHRKRYVPDCIKLTPQNVANLDWMPSTCAYKRLHEGRGLPSWHPLLTGDPDSVHTAGVSVRDQVISETALADPEDAVDFPAYELMRDPQDDETHRAAERRTAQSGTAAPEPGSFLALGDDK